MAMIKGYLIRFKSSDQGRLGLFLLDSFEAKTIELPWKDNRPNVSCIPTGLHKCEYRYSRKYKGHYHITGVPNRTWILTHNGVWAGDVEKGYRTHSAGCVIMGKYHGKYKGQDCVFVSRITLRRLVNFMKKEPFELEVKDVG